MLEARPWLAVALSLVLCPLTIAWAPLNLGSASPRPARAASIHRARSALLSALGAVPSLPTTVDELPSASKSDYDRKGVDEVESPLPHAPPPRWYDQPGYVAPEHLRTWERFQYETPEVRRATVRQWAVSRPDAYDVAVTPLKVVLIGGPASGKGTIGMMLSQAFRLRVIGAGSLLRGEVRAGTERGRQAAAAMARGDLLPDSVVLNALDDCLDCWDARINGWLLDGFPRTPEQAHAVLSDAQWASLRPDAVVILERPDELVKEFVLGRMTDTASGQTYHPIYAPPPSEIEHRIVWRVDDTPDVVEQRLVKYKEDENAILNACTAAGVPFARFDNARSEIETFYEVATFLDGVRSKKKEIEASAETELTLKSDIDTGEDVAELCGSEDEQCIIDYEEYADQGSAAKLLEAVLRCNEYDAADYLPVLVGQTQVGWASQEMVGHLRPFQGHMCRFTSAENGDPAIELAPFEETGEGRTEVVAELVRSLVADGVVKKRSLRNELQEVRPIDTGFVGPDGPPPLLHIERAAMIYFGVPSHGVHINGYVRDPEKPDDPRPHSVWIATRSLSKATYPGLLDQVVAGGQPSSMTLLENVQKECEEEASFPAEVVQNVRATGLVSYRYATRKGLSTKRLVTFDVELPQDLSPLCADGEVEKFTLTPVGEMLDSIRYQLPRWKPNSALVAIDFAMRHGIISPDEPGFVQLAQMLRAR